MGIRPAGRPRQRWQEEVMEDLKKLEVKNWKEAAKDRRTWRDVAEKAKTHKKVIMPNDDDDDDRKQFKNTKMSKLREKEYRLLSLAADGTTGLLSAVA